MRALMLAAVAALAATACSQSEAPAGEREKSNAEAVSTPASSGSAQFTPRAGKWRISTQVPGMTQATVAEICLDAASFAEMQAAGGETGAKCDQPKMTPTAGGFTSQTTCTYEGGMKATIDQRYSGDMQSRYTVETTTRMDPAPNPALATSTMTATAERLGDC
jgi:hypothetical protein